MTIIGWVGNLFLVLGALRMAHKNRHAFAYSICGGLCWLHEASLTGRFDWIFIETVMLFAAARNYWHWLNDRSTTELP